jgi:hypothetical protein
VAIDERQPELLANLPHAFTDDEGEQPPGRERADADPSAARHGPDLRLDAPGPAGEARQQLDGVTDPDLAWAGAEGLDAGRAVTRGRATTGEKREKRERTGETARQGHVGSSGCETAQEPAVGHPGNVQSKCN